MKHRNGVHTPASAKHGLWAFGLFFLFAHLVACNCDGKDDNLLSTRCDPFDPELARNFDSNIVDVCDAKNVDEDCDGIPDKDCQCDNAETRDCSDEPNAGTGACVWGTQTCEYNGVWGACMGAGHSSDEVCDTDFVDEDCDNMVNEEDDSLVFRVFPGTECFSSTVKVVFKREYPDSLCEHGIPKCINGVEVCQGEVLPLPYEECNLKDDNCNGETNERSVQEMDPVTGAVITCGPDEEVGICRRGIQKCVGLEVVCQDNPDTPGVYEPIWPAGEERCDGKDNNCDGQTDEDIKPRDCSYLACLGTEECVNGEWGNCTASVPVLEVCFDLVDNDCDGQIDEDCGCIVNDFRPCFDQIMNSPNPDCGRGIEFCQTDGTWGQCDYFDSIPELCNLGHDDDCDPATTEENSAPQICGTDVGLCQSGLLFCLPDGTMDTVCQDNPNVQGLQPVWPSFEICDGLDNNCNDLIDDGVVPRNAVALLFQIDESGSMCPYIMNLSLALATYLGDFALGDHVCAIEVVPGRAGGARTMITNGFVDFATCQQIVSTLGCNGGYSEWNIDAMIQATALMSTVPWPPDKYPYIFYIGDEQNQTALYPTVTAAEIALATQTTVCLLPGCQPPGCNPVMGCQPGPPEMFVIENPSYAPTYSGILNNTVNVRQRFFDIFANDPLIYREYLDRAFQDVCF